MQRKIAKLLIITGSYNEALEIIQGIYKIDEEKIYLEARTHMLLNEHSQAVKCLKSIINNKATNKEKVKEFNVDKSILKLLIEIKHNPEAIFQAYKHCSS